MTADRIPLAQLPTPLTPAPRLAEAAGTRWPLLVKRDDLTGLGTVGSKARPMEFLLGAAVRDGCDILVTGGGPGSNFCQAAALAASRAGLDCEVLVAAEQDRIGSPNMLIARRSGASLRSMGTGERSGIDEAVEQRVAELVAEGRRPFAMPRGGGTPVGVLGFACAAEELSHQLAEIHIEPALVVIAVGSGASCAGLLADSTSWPLLGVTVSRPLEDATATVRQLAYDCAARLGRPGPDVNRLEIVDAIGPGFGIPAAHDVAAAELALRTEGLFLDKTYTAKALAVLLDRLRAGVEGPVVFWHTGGLVSAITSYVDKGRSDYESFEV